MMSSEKLDGYFSRSMIAGIRTKLCQTKYYELFLIILYFFRCQNIGIICFYVLYCQCDIGGSINFHFYYYIRYFSKPNRIN